MKVPRIRDLLNWPEMADKMLDKAMLLQFWPASLAFDK